MPFSDQITTLAKSYINELKYIDGVKPPTKEGSAQQQVLAERIDAARGRPLFFNYVGSGRGRGPYVELMDGSVKMDLINGIGIHVLGHSHPEIVEKTLEAALSDVVLQGNLQPNHEYLDMMEKLVEVAARKSKLKHAWLCQSGSMANENGLKICRQKTNGARMVLSFSNSFAGRTTMMAEITDNDNYRVGLPRYDEVLRIPFYDAKNPNSTNESLEALKKQIEKHRGNIGCFMFEPMQGEGGYRAAPREFFLPLLDLCKAEGIPIFLDEVQTFCRTSEFFAFQTLDIGEYADVVSVAKSLQNGATLYTEEFNPQPGLISGTFSGSTASLAAGTKVLNILDNEGYMGANGKVMKIHNNFISMLNELSETTCKGLVSEAGGLGLMVAFTPFDGSKDKMLKLVKRLFDNGLMCFGCGSNPFRVRFLLPAILEDKHIAEAKKILESTLLQLKD